MISMYEHTLMPFAIPRISGFFGVDVRTLVLLAHHAAIISEFETISQSPMVSVGTDVDDHTRQSCVKSYASPSSPIGPMHNLGLPEKKGPKAWDACLRALRWATRLPPNVVTAPVSETLSSHRPYNLAGFGPARWVL